MNQQQETNWWNRNWKWFVPVGGLGAIILLALFCALIAYIAFGFVKSSGVNKEAIAKAKMDSGLMHALGSPIKEGIFVTGNMKISGASGQADLTIPISGPKGKATLYVLATKSADKWKFSTLEVAISGSGERINLLFNVSSSLARFLGSWEYRQRNSSSPTGYDNQGEILKLIQVCGVIKGFYFGLERTGEHGLWYTLVEIQYVKVSEDGRITFMVPARNLYRDRPDSLKDIETLRNTSTGFTRTELKFQGQLKNNDLILHCISEPSECPEEVMVFRKGKWTQS